MSLADEDFTGLARTIGRLRLEAEEAKPRRGRPPKDAGSSDAETAGLVSGLRIQLDEARTAETKALLLLSQAKKTLAESQEQAAEYKRHVGRLEAEARGKDQRISDLQRQVAQRVEAPAPVQADCPVCTAIKLMVLGVQRAEPKVVRRRPTRTKAIVIDALEQADSPMTAESIAKTVGLARDVVLQAVWRMMQSEDSLLLRFGKAGNRKGENPGYQYWLADRPLPEGFAA